MNAKKILPAIAIALSLGVFCPEVFGQDTVTVPKSRLEELERKEAELNKLKGDLNTTKGDLDKTKGDLNKTKDENLELKKLHEADAAKIAETPQVVKYVSPPMNSLPPVTAGKMVDAMDLADHYRMDPAAADQRYRKQVFQVQGEVVGFRNPLFLKPYRIFLKTPDQSARVICSVQPPEKYSAVYTVKEGSQLVGTMPRYEDEVIARLGDTVVVEGKCDGVKDSVVHMSECALISVHGKVSVSNNH